MVGPRSRFALVLLAVAGLALGVAALAAEDEQQPWPEGASGPELSLRLEARAGIQRALRFLAGAQKENGSWADQPAVTALVVAAMLRSGEEEFGVEAPAVARALAYVRSFAQPDGGIYDRAYASYSTSICAMALAEAALPEDRELVGRAWDFLLGAQADESEDVNASSLEYGGWGYEPAAAGQEGKRADMSNTQFALDALHALETRAGDGDPERRRCTELAYGKAVTFLQRCQNLKSANDQPWASDDGGFVYRPGESKADETPEGGLRSYASMTYAGLKAMVYAQLKRDDPRVVAAYDWCRQHWSLEENPGLGQQGLYYYYLVLSRALDAYGEEGITDADGRAHPWRTELADRLLSIQQGDGSWVNPNARWMESMPELVTAYSVIALEHALGQGSR